MFTGIVAETGEVVDVTDTDDGRRVRVAAAETLEGVDHGASISVSGVCLTVEDWGEGWFEVFVASETRSKTTLGDVAVGDPVNLERALRADDRLDGHFVQGHVDTTTEIVDVRRVGEDWEFEFALPEGHERHVAPRGSVALDGISLTVAERGEETFTVAVIPTTYDLTTLGAKAAGDRVNVEVDVVAKYVEGLTEGY